LIHAIYQADEIKSALFNFIHFRLRSPAPFVGDLAIPPPRDEQFNQNSRLSIGRNSRDFVSMAHWDYCTTLIHSRFHPKLFFELSTLLELNLWELRFKFISFLVESRRICRILFALRVSDETFASVHSILREGSPDQKAA
jgi:hypothetical protein